jgi:hypothetical protein
MTRWPPVLAALVTLAAGAAACGGSGKWPTSTTDVERQFVSLCRHGEVRVGARGSQLAGASNAVCTCIVHGLRTRMSYSDFKDVTSAAGGGVQLDAGPEARAVAMAATRCQKAHP